VIPLQAQRGPEGGWGIALLFHDHGTRRWWVVSSMPRPHFTPGKDPVPILQEDGLAPGPVWTGRKSRPHRDSILTHPAYSQSLYWPSYPAHNVEDKAQIWKLWRKCKRGRKLGKFNSRKIKRSSEKINKYSLDMGRWNGDMTWIRGNGAACTDEVKEESRHVHGHVQSNLSPT